MIHPDTELRFKDPDIGHGVYATRFIPRGTIVWTLCELDIRIPPAKLATFAPAYRALIDLYAYVDAVGDRILCWDHGRYVNHSCEPAMISIGPAIEIAVRDLQPGDELTCEYGTLNLVEPLQCRCGAPQCRGRIGADDVLALAAQLDEAASAALAAAGDVAQPLLPFVGDRQAWDAWVAGAEAVPSSRHFHCAHA